jgi:hypothetical protein
MTFGKTARGNARRLKRARAGQTTSVVRGSSLVNTKIPNVEQETRNGAVDQVKLLKAFIAPICRRVCNSKSFLTCRNRFMKGGSQAYNLILFILLKISFINRVRESLFYY